MLLINISTDKVYLDDGTRQETLDRNGIEDVLGPTLLARSQASPFQEIFLINGPGGFTNLRVGTLMLNMLNAVAQQHIQIFSTDKLTLFAYLVDRKILPPVGVIYLGQKHNVRVSDFSHKPITHDEYKLDTIPLDAFLDEVYDPYRPKGEKNMIHFTNQKGKISISYHDQSHEIILSDLQLTPTIHVEANYMIEPVVN